MAGVAAPPASSRRPLQENLEVCEDRSGAWIRCARCGHVLCSQGEDWTKRCAVRALPPTQAGPLMADLVGQFLLEQLCCPSCGALVSTEIKSRDEVGG